MNATQVDGFSNLHEDLDETIISVEELHLDSSDVSDCDEDNDESTKMICDLCEKSYFDETLLMEHRLLCHGDSLDECLNGEPTEEVFSEDIIDQLDGNPDSPSEISESEDQEMSHENSDEEMSDANADNQVATNANVSIFFGNFLFCGTLP